MSEVSEIDPTFFGSPDYVPTTRDIDMKSARVERGILPDAQIRFNELLKNKGWTQITEIEGDGRLPTLDEWVSLRITNRRGTKFFPCFVADGQKNIFFLKTQTSNEQGSLASLADEAKILKQFNQMGLPSPKFYEYGESGGKTLAFIRLEAITPDRGRVGKPSDWKVEHAKSAVELIKMMEEADLEELPVELTSIKSFQTGMKASETMMNLADQAGEYLPAEIKVSLNKLKETGAEVGTVLAHGDMTLKNIVIDKDGKVLPVDFELAKTGFLGQDAGKLLSGLRKNPEVFQATLENYITDKDGQVDEARLRGLVIGMALENLVHLTWRVKNSVKNDETIAEMNNFIENIKGALKIEEQVRSKVTNKSTI